MAPTRSPAAVGPTLPGPAVCSQLTAPTVGWFPGLYASIRKETTHGIQDRGNESAVRNPPRADTRMCRGEHTMLGRQTPRVAGTRPATTLCPDRDLSIDLPPDLTISHAYNRARTAPTPSSAGGAMNLAALYARVSSDIQEKDQTIASQLAALRQAAQERGYQVPPDWEFIDDGYSGARLDRPALERLRDLAAEGAFAAVLVYAPDRLARNYAYQVVILEELTRAGCEVCFLNHAFGESPEEQMLLQIQGVWLLRCVSSSRIYAGFRIDAREIYSFSMTY